MVSVRFTYVVLCLSCIPLPWRCLPSRLSAFCVIAPSYLKDRRRVFRVKTFLRLPPSSLSTHGLPGRFGAACGWVCTVMSAPKDVSETIQTVLLFYLMVFSFLAFQNDPRETSTRGMTLALFLFLAHTLATMKRIPTFILSPTPGTRCCPRGHRPLLLLSAVSHL